MSLPVWWGRIGRMLDRNEDDGFIGPYGNTYRKIINRKYQFDPGISRGMNMDKILYHVINLHTDAKNAFRMFIENEQIQTWLCPTADIEPLAGGKYELFWNPEDREYDSTIGCRITAIEPNKFLSFEWKGPKQFNHFMNNADPLTHVVVFFIPREKGNDSISSTDVHLIHTGWRNSAEWDEARSWFERAWNEAFRVLIKKVNGS